MPEIVIKSETQKVAEAKVECFRSHLGPFVVAAETTRMAMLFMDAKEPGNPIIFANDAFLDLTGYNREEVLGQSFNFLMARGTDPESLARIDIAFAGHPQGRFGNLLPPQGRRRVLVSNSYQSGAGRERRCRSAFRFFVDLTDHKQEQAQSRMLIDELNHRVKNTLATVQSIVWQALRNTTDPEAIRESIESASPPLPIARPIDPRELGRCGTARLGQGGLGAVRGCQWTVGALCHYRQNIGSHEGRPCSRIAFHELATNAVKYGSFSNKSGSVLISWTIEPHPEGNRLLLRWQEKNGPHVTPPSRTGFGTRVIERGLAHELEGAVHLDYRADGVVCTINFPAPNGSRDG